MKIAFLCGGLESGKNGVGDYTRFLAQECARQGHETALLALHDPHAASTRQAYNMTSAVCIPELRLSSSQSREESLSNASRFIASFDPDWVSLQFVPYAFHSKGIIKDLPHYLQALIDGRKLHVMLHELWIGAEQGAPLKDRGVGTLQRFYIEQMLRKLKPSSIHTSNEAYVARLTPRGIGARKLALFGNIPVQEKNADDWLLPKLRAVGLDITAINRNRFWLFGMFGGLHSVWPPEPLLSVLRDTSARAGRKIAFLSIGSLGPGEALWKTMTARYGSEFVFLNLGRQSAETISEYFNSLDVGLAASPLSLIGKSSCVVTMREHGLPVIVNRDDVHYPGLKFPTNEDAFLYRLDDQLVENLIAGLPHSPVGSRLAEVANQFLADMKLA